MLSVACSSLEVTWPVWQQDMRRQHSRKNGDATVRQWSQTFCHDFTESSIIHFLKLTIEYKRIWKQHRMKHIDAACGIDFAKCHEVIKHFRHSSEDCAILSSNFFFRSNVVERFVSTIWKREALSFCEWRFHVLGQRHPVCRLQPTADYRGSLLVHDVSAKSVNNAEQLVFQPCSSFLTHLWFLAWTVMLYSMQYLVHSYVSHANLRDAIHAPNCAT